MPNSARLVAPLNKLLKKKAPTNFNLDGDECAAVKDLKQNLIKTPIFALPETDEPFRIKTDTCDEQVGCVLLQQKLTKTTPDQ